MFTDSSGESLLTYTCVNDICFLSETEDSKLQGCRSLRIGTQYKFVLFYFAGVVVGPSLELQAVLLFHQFF